MLDILRTFSGPQCAHDIRSVCEYLRVEIDYSAQVSLTNQIILSHDDNETKIVTTANTINTLLTGAGGSRIRLQKTGLTLRLFRAGKQRNRNEATHLGMGFPKMLTKYVVVFFFHLKNCLVVIAS